MATILIDSDSCPKLFRRRLFERSYSLKIRFVGTVSAPPLRLGEKRHPDRVEWVCIPPGWEATDKAIVALVNAGDPVFSDDWALRIMAFYKGAAGICFRGNILTQERIDIFVARKRLNRPAWSVKIPPQPPYTDEDALRAIESLHALLGGPFEEHPNC